ncbi:acetoacetate decarboxylase family protein [Phenylobacterium deserti]|uniref:Acetoacetate decarboxylase n=1 Tax=Phenylobacterium deserti TaxID=1914756 RepID=A0A328AU36_9CAUL|nr:acetoacetate decarboxylase family protein [Phenylobacterium deserti]RAK57034.1 acetoacetate decarboxylase [Phenylobacterium deserti]
MQSAAASPAFPPPPWRLSGEAYLSVWLIPRDELDFDPPQGFAPVHVAGRLVVGGFWARYRPPGVLSYDELAVGVLVRRGSTLAVTIPWIWVDSEASKTGARTLWAIPKAIARFAEGSAFAASDRSGERLAVFRPERALPLPLPLPFRLTIAQPGESASVLTPARITGWPGVARGEWRAAGPISFLDGRQPLLAGRLARARVRFGRAS